jgi:hypothetical protein
MSPMRWYSSQAWPTTGSVKRIRVTCTLAVLPEMKSCSPMLRLVRSFGSSASATPQQHTPHGPRSEGRKASGFRPEEPTWYVRRAPGGALNAGRCVAVFTKE